MRHRYLRVIVLLLVLASLFACSCWSAPRVFTSVACGLQHTLALKSDGTVWAWGINGYGQSGNGTTASSSVQVQVPSLSGVVAIAASDYHCLAVKSDGTVWAWGYNNYGQLGIGTKVNSLVPVQVSNLTDMVAVAAGGRTSCAVRRDGTVWAWGSNLGDGTTGGSTVPVQVPGLEGVTAIATEGSGSLAMPQFNLVLKSDGTVWAWGANQSGQLGNGTTGSSSLVPVQVSNLTDVASISAGVTHSLAARNDGTAWSWGYNRYGELGDGTTTSSSLPVLMSSLSGVRAVAGGFYHSLMVKGDGTVWACGRNNYGQLGNGTLTDSLLPVQVQNLTGAVGVAACMSHSAAVTGDGALWTWGSNDYGQLGNGTTVSSSVPVKVVSLPVAAADDNYSTASGAVLAVAAPGVIANDTQPDGWPMTVTLLSGPAKGSVILHEDGSFAYTTKAGFAGVDTFTYTATDGHSSATATVRVAVAAGGPANLFGAVAGGYAHSVALKRDGTVWAWGRNGDGQLGNGTTTGSSVPVQTSSLSGALAVTAGEFHSLALLGDGTVMAWGSNQYGQLGREQADSPVPTAVPGLTGAMSVAAGDLHSLAIKGDGTVWAWGCNWCGQLGDNTTTNRRSPVQVRNITGVTAIAAGSSGSMALKSDGSVWIWGSNRKGWNDLVPVQVPGLVCTAIAEGSGYNLVLKSDGTVWAWGYNTYGQLGNGNTTDSTTPVPVSNLTDVVAIAAGSTHSLAIKRDGTVWTWGCNIYGELGNGNTTNSLVPVQVPGLCSIVSIAGGQAHSLAVASDGTVWEWGLNDHGQLGNSGTTNSLVPVRVFTGAVTSSDDYYSCPQDRGLMIPAPGVLANDFSPYGLPLTATVTRPPSRGTLRLSTNGSLLYIPALVLPPTQAFTGVDTFDYSVTDGVLSSTSRVTIAVYSPTANRKYAAIAAGNMHNLAVRVDGTMWSWGSSEYGQLGNWTFWESLAPQPVSGMANASAIACGESHSLAVGPCGLVWAWGGNREGQLGNYTWERSSVPAQVPGIANAVTVAGGIDHSLALRWDGTVWAWGANSYGQLGDGSTTRSSLPVQVAGLANVTDIAGGGFHSLALTGDRTVWAWGCNSQGQLGNGTATDGVLAARVSGLKSVVAIAGGLGHSAALKDDDTVWTWGSNTFGQLGDSTVTDRLTPVQVQSLSGVAAIAAGRDHTLALKWDGTVWAWGLNDCGQLGNGTLVDSAVPVQVADLTGVFAIAAGGGHSLALKSDGTLWGWGDNTLGQLGIGTTADSLVPVPCGTVTGPGISITSPSMGMTYVSTQPTLSMSGTAYDDFGVASVTWSNNSTGNSGVCAGKTEWSVSGIPLRVGVNQITLVATGVSGYIAVATPSVIYDPTAPTVKITSPSLTGSFSTTSASVDLAGTASDNVEIASVTWSTNSGATGQCSGTTSWTAAGIPLQPSDNDITITAADIAGNTSVDTIHVERLALSIGEARRKPLETEVYVGNAAVTSVSTEPGVVFIESVDRTCGIKLVTSAAVSVGQRVRVAGVLGRVDGEYQIGGAKFVSVEDGAPIAPLLMTTRSLGNNANGSLDYTGLNTTGLLVRFAGKVTSFAPEQGLMHVDDGTGCLDGVGPARGIRVYLPSGVSLNVDDSVIVTGISRVATHTLTGGAEVYAPSVWAKDADGVRVL